MDENSVKYEPLGNGFGVFVSAHHNFGTDAILLADFAKARRENMVDIGTGCGIIPLIILRNGGAERVIGVDISPEACGLAEATVQKLGIENFDIICSDINDLKGKMQFGCRSLVTCNPPYKACGAGIKNPDNVEAVARHEVKCTLEDIVSIAARMLQTSGRFCICHRPERLAELMELMRRYQLEPKRMRFVAQRIGEEPWLVLVEGKKCAKTGLRIMPILYIEQDGKLTDEMIEIYGSYKEEYL